MNKTVVPLPIVFGAPAQALGWRRWAASVMAWISVPVAAQGLAAPTYADVAPLLAERCVMCHTGDAAPSGLRLDSLEAVLRGSQKGPVVRAGDAAGSELVRRIKGQSQPRMPMTGPPYLSDAQIDLVERWVAGGMLRGAGGEASAGSRPAPAMPLRPALGEPVTYAHVAPLLAQRCAKCHTGQGLMGPAPEGYRLDGYAATLSAADRVRVVPGVPQASELLRRIRGQSRPRMPFDGPPYLSEDDTRLIEAWIAQGARDAAGQAAPLPLGAQLRLGGTLDPVSGWQLDGLPLGVDGRTRIDKRPGPGDVVEVRGRVGPGGRVEVERLRRR
jgi:mono/diheme cytochrome c family protein